MTFILLVATGGVIPIWLISSLVGKISPLKSLTPSRNILYSGLVAYAASVALAGFGAADGGPWDPGYMWVAYLVSLAIVVTLRTTLVATRERRKVEG